MKRIKCSECCGFGVLEDGDDRCLCMNCQKMLMIEKRLIPVTTQDVIDFVGDRHKGLDRSNKDVLEWRYTMTVKDILDAFSLFASSQLKQGLNSATKQLHNAS